MNQDRSTGPSINVGSARHVLTDYALPADFAQHSRTYIEQICWLLGLNPPEREVDDRFIRALDRSLAFYTEEVGTETNRLDALVPGLIAVCGEFVIHKFNGKWMSITDPTFLELEPWVCDFEGRWYPAFIAANTFNEIENGVSIAAVLSDIIASRCKSYPYS